MDELESVAAATDPVNALRAIHARLQAIDADADAMKDGGNRAQKVAMAENAALKATGLGTRQGCQDAISAISQARDEIVYLRNPKNSTDRAKRVADTLAAVFTDLKAISWDVATAVPVLTLGQLATAVALSATIQTIVSIPLSLDVASAQDVTVPYQMGNIPASWLSDPAAVTGQAVIRAGSLAGTIDLVFGPRVVTQDVLGAVTLGAPVNARLGPRSTTNFTIAKNVTQASKGVITFEVPIGTIVRDPVNPTNYTIEVARDNVSTKDPAVAPVQVVGLPDGVITQLGMAQFAAGSKRGYASMVLAPYGTKAVQGAAVRMPGRADLTPTELFDLGPTPSQDFVVQDGQDVVTNPIKWTLPGGSLSGLPWLDGLSSNWDLASAMKCAQLLERPLEVCGGGSHSGGRTATWEALSGGPLSSNHTSYDNFASIGNDNQLHVQGTNLEVSFQIIKPQKGIIVAWWKSVPDDVKVLDWADIASGRYDAYLYAMGRRAWALMKHYGLSGWQLVVRWNKEFNGGGYNLPLDNTAMYGRAQGRQIAAFNQGYTEGGADSPARHVLGLARHDQIGPLRLLVPVDAHGAPMIQAIDISSHPSNQLDRLAALSLPQQIAGVRAWLRGSMDRDCYAHDHADPQFSGLATAHEFGIGISNFEWSPRADQYRCLVASAAYIAHYQFWMEHKDVFVGAGVYHPDTINTSLTIPGWAAGVSTYIEYFSGKHAGA